MQWGQNFFEGISSMDDLARAIFLSSEGERLVQQTMINTYDDLVGTFWTNNCLHFFCGVDENFFHFSRNFGYIFLPNNLIMTVETTCKAFFSKEYNHFFCIDTTITRLVWMSSYEINTDGIIVCPNQTNLIGYGRIFLKDHYLYIPFYGEHQRFRLVNRFGICSNCFIGDQNKRTP